MPTPLPRFRTCATALALALAFFAQAGCSKKAPAGATRFLTLESDPPGCTVLLDGKVIGQTPFTLSEGQLLSLDLKWPETITKGNSLWESWGVDATSITVETDRTAETRRKLFFKPDEKVAAAYSSAETPWGPVVMGRELSFSNTDDNHVTYRYVGARPVSSDGLVLQVQLQDKGATPGRNCAIKLTCQNQAAGAFSGFRPEVVVYCSRYDEPSRSSEVVRQALPDEWRFFKAGETNSAVLQFTAPVKAGDYCVYAMVTFYKDTTGERIYNGVYSEGKLLHIGGAEDNSGSGTK